MDDIKKVSEELGFELTEEEIEKISGGSTANLKCDFCGAQLTSAISYVRHCRACPCNPCNQK